MKTRLIIQTDNIEDRNALMGVLYSYGAIFHRISSPGQYDLVAANKGFQSLLQLQLEFRGGELDICASSTRVPDVNFSTDPAEALKSIKEYIKAEPTSIIVKNVGDYEAEVKADGIHIYGQVISFEKFDEISAAFEKLNK
jgi:hypothetical protein